MKKTLVVLLLVALICFAFAGCGTKLVDFTGITFSDVTVDYDGNGHTITAQGVPSGATVTYTNAGPHTKPGEYTIGVKVTAEGYNDYTASAKLVINGATFSGITFENVTLDYDGSTHTITAQNVPDFATVTYTNAGPHKLPGEYTIGVKVTAEGYNDYTASAKLKINALNFTGITFENATLDYDANQHTIKAQGAPSFATVTYTGAGPHKLPGEYTIGVTVSAEGYNDYTASAKLKINALNFTGITFENATLDYDANQHTIEAQGVPAFATVTYTGAGPFVNAGSYPISVKVTAEGYNDYTASATLVINKIDFANVTFENKSFEYDGNSHSIAIVGNLPTTATVVYTSDVDGVANSAVAPGAYNVTATISAPNYNTLQLTATLNITTTDEERFMASVDNKLYFQNAMDDDKLYLYDFSTSTVVRVSSDNAVDMMASDGGILFVSSTALISSVKETSYDGTKHSTNTIYTKTGVRYVQRQGDVVYFVINGLTNEKSGIYKLDCSNQDTATPVCLSVGKARHLTLVGDTLYFADGNNSNKLSKISAKGGENQTRTVVVDEKIHNLISYDGALIYTVNGLLDDYIEKYTISNNARKKLTSDAGQSLTVVGDKLYYVNVDLFSTNFIGQGIYSVKLNPLADNSNPGTQVIKAGSAGVCSLATDGSNLFYYDVQDYSLVKYNLSSGSTTNLLAGFVKPEDPAPILSDSKLVTYNGTIYYTNMLDGRKLYCYNPQNKSNICITTDKVTEFEIANDTLYVNMVTWLVNNGVFKANLKTGAAFEQISNKAGESFCTDGTYLYYIKSNKVIKYDLSTETESVLFDDGNIKELQLIGDKLYFIQTKTLRKNNSFYVIDLKAESLTAVQLLVNGETSGADTYTTDGTYLYYREFYSTKSRLACCKLDGTEYRAMMEETNDPIEIVCYGDYVYYYNETNTTANNGLYRIGKAAGSVAEKLLSKDVKYAMNFTVLDNYVYFVDYNRNVSIVSGVVGVDAGDGHLYRLAIGSSTPEKLN